MQCRLLYHEGGLCWVHLDPPYFRCSLGGPSAVVLFSCFLLTEGIHASEKGEIVCR